MNSQELRRLSIVFLHLATHLNSMHKNLFPIRTEGKRSIAYRARRQSCGFAFSQIQE